MKVFALIVAAGFGQRFGGNIPKQFCSVGGFVPLIRSVETFFDCGFISGLVCVIPEQYSKIYNGLIHCISDGRLLSPVFGGSTRQRSVNCGLSALKRHNPDYVMIHDASRCYCSSALIERIYKQLKFGSEAVVPVINPVDSIRYNGKSVQRDAVSLVQTPQGFKYETIMRLHEKYTDEKFTDDASLCDKAGIKVSTVEGEHSNIKLTYKSDIPMGTYRTGYGYDAHRISDNPERQLYLMGLKIDGYVGLDGISDADVGIHSLIDAILGALCVGSIGDYFPEHDTKNQGARSTIFLEKCRKFLHAKNADITNIDTTIVCEEPKISRYSYEMKSIVANCLKIEPSIINIKGKTTEGLGFEGRREGISATSVVTVRMM